MDERKIELKALWNKVASEYSIVGPGYWNDFGKRLVGLSNIEKGAQVLDVGTGRGSTLFPAAEAAGYQGQVTGIDIAENMVSIVNYEIVKRKINNAKVISRDMEEAEFQEGYYSNIISGFCLGGFLRNKEYMSKVLRSLKTGGQLSFSIWGMGNDQQWLTDIVNQYLPSDAGNGQSTYSNEDLITDMKASLKQLDMKDISILDETTTVYYKDENQWWNEMNSNAVRGVLDSIRAIGEKEFSKFQSKVNLYLGKMKTNDGIGVDMNVIYVTANKK